MNKKLLINSFFGLVISLIVSSCGIFGNSKAEAPINSKLGLEESRGSMTGGAGLLSMGGSKNNGPGIGVNSFLWRATLDTLAFLPLVSADPFGGVIITDWYEDPKTKGERFKVNALIIDKTLRADGIKITLFKQKLDEKGAWRDMEVSKNLAADLEDTILTRAREMRLSQASK